MDTVYMASHQYLINILIRLSTVINIGYIDIAGTISPGVAVSYFQPGISKSFQAGF